VIVALALLASLFSELQWRHVGPFRGGRTKAATGVQQSLQEILEEPATGETYRYDPQGRRDPFQSLVGPAPKLQPANSDSRLLPKKPISPMQSLKLCSPARKFPAITLLRTLKVCGAALKTPAPSPAPSRSESASL